METKMQLCGIDEAGRGPIAGPLVMAGVVLLSPVAGLNDSKKLTGKKRETLFEEIIKKSRYHIAHFSAQQIDDDGMSHCLSEGLKTIMRAIADADFLFDGNSTFGVDGLKTMVKADVTVPEVSAASILAKVTRDKEMVQMAQRYPDYGFEGHKGYGTAAHIDAIRRHGYCEIHRRSFRLKALEPTLF